MKRFSKKAAFFAGTVALVFIVYARVFIGGEDDNFYRRFTTPPAPSLVVGSSRCAQGIVPSVVISSSLNFSRPLYNYCFTNANSPYGPYYLESIKKKLEKEKSPRKRGLFVVEVNPWILSVKQAGLSESDFREADRFIAEMEIVNHVNPNIEYILKRYNTTHYKTIYFDVIGVESSSFLKKSGWLRVDVDISERKVERRKQEKIEDYKELTEEWSLSSARVEYLGETISFLNQYGRVFAVRMPVSKEMFHLEQAYAPTFDAKVDSVVRVSGGTYLNYSASSGRYQTTDGNHLWRKAAHRFTRTLIDSLR
ncbi:hypothetical protein [Salinibacter ruber]|uniref:hypothetical protein n=1 Tax=Salinibacter ruber TaxID=146919 RepID=UPI002168765D|nr:hypothetical protein [Salinibacter ruber]MCS4136397.1 hypothetical protein [Salinibacter ruber]